MSQKFIEACQSLLTQNPGQNIFKTAEIWTFAKESGINPDSLMTFVKPYRVQYGKYDLSQISTSNTEEPVETTVIEKPAAVPAPREFVKDIVDGNAYIPTKNPLYVKTDFYDDLVKIVSSGRFMPVIVQGPTGDGKTMTVEQVAAACNRPMVRVNFTGETDEDSLLGGYRLINGETVFVTGPVVTAMEKGCILLMDEFDLARPQSIMCMQSIMEGNGVHLKRANRWLMPAPGFMIIATSNTKGSGDDTGKYISAQHQNEAFLDRFKMMFVTDYMNEVQEGLALRKVFKELGLSDEDNVIQWLTSWTKSIRIAAKETPDVTYVISTRRLIDIAHIWAIFGGKIEDAVKRGLKRFDEHHEVAFFNMFMSVKPAPVKKVAKGAIPKNWNIDDEEPF